nr:7-deoxyloganetin glucosyltransferase-like [Tanacetum cinerariifolium]
MGFTLAAAKEFNIPEFLLWTSGAASLICFDQYPILLDKGLMPIKDPSFIVNGYLDTVLDFVPTMNGIRLKDIPPFVRYSNPGDEYLNKWFMSQLEKAKSASAIIFNTCDELDADVLDVVSLKYPPCYAIVVYVNFGSITVMTPQQLVEFGWGLAKSNYSFLWIIRPDLVIRESSVLPDELLKQTKDRCLLASWCPQEQVLKHPSVGGFLTHSGWNSTIESISSGVPMISWPFFDLKKKAEEACTSPLGSSMVNLEKIIHLMKASSSVNIFYNRLDAMTRQLLDSHGPIPIKTPAQAYHSHKWQDMSKSRRMSSDSSESIATITNKLDSLGRDMKRLKENVYVIQVACENCKGAHLNKECSLNEEVKSIEKVKYGEFRQSFQIIIGTVLETEDWMKKLLESMDLNTRNQNTSLKNLETQIEQLAKDYQAKAANEVSNPSVRQCKAIFANNEAPTKGTASKGTNELDGVSFIFDDNVHVLKETREAPQRVLPCQLPPKELNPGSFTLPCIIGSLKFYAMTDLGDSVNIMPKSMFNHLKLTNLKETNMMVEMADMTKKTLVGIVENIQVLRNEEFKFWPICDPSLRECNGRDRIHVLDEWGNIKKWECNRDDERRNEKGKEMLCSDLLLIKYEYSKIDDTVRARRKSQKLIKNPLSRSLEEYKLVFDIKIEQLEDEYELGMGKKGYILDDIWDKCEQVHGGTMYSSHDEEFEKEKHWESGYYIREKDARDHLD